MRDMWARGWSPLVAILLFSFVSSCIGWFLRAILPDVGWLRVTVGLMLFVLAAPILAAWAARVAAVNAAPLPRLDTVEVESFSDEVSAHLAVAALEQRGVHAVMAPGSVGPQSGLPIPAGGIRVLVARSHLAKARSVLAAARAPG